jgi:hypothetical protein
MRNHFFVVDKKGIESWFSMDLKVGTEWYGGEVVDSGFSMLRAALNAHRGCYYMKADLDEETEKELVELVGEQKQWLKGKRLIEKYTGRNFETEKLSKHNRVV